MTSEMVERVAMAIGTAEYGYVDKYDTPNNWASSLALAAVAIEAMREPTSKMIHRMDGLTDLVGPYDEANTKGERLKEFSCAWSVAIDAALEP